MPDNATDLAERILRCKGCTLNDAHARLLAHAVLERDQLLDLTELLDEHPAGYDGPCLCKECQSYG